DFSGYTDMAIGIALLLGITFPQNFDRPYAAVSLQDFWRRWHMTLSRWLRDYLYIPLGGSRRGEWQASRNILLTMTLGGLWHGAALTFLAWGVFHGVLLAVERVGRRWLGSPGGVWPHPLLGRLLTFHVVCVGWVLFRADSLATAGELLQRSITSWGPAPAVTAGPVAVIAASLALQALPTGWALRFEAGFAELPLPVQGVALGTFFALVVALGPAGVAPFIYYQF
ncbi:MAG: MBOAT family protein, partial [Chloroflexota bacterium]|nr:MBOAT family protein [Chloroflexota bacterium]